MDKQHEVTDEGTTYIGFTFDGVFYEIESDMRKKGNIEPPMVKPAMFFFVDKFNYYFIYKKDGKYIFEDYKNQIWATEDKLERLKREALKY